MSITTAEIGERSTRSPTAGRVCFWGGLVGVAQAFLLMVWPSAVSDDRYSFPLTATDYVVAQTSFFLQHLALIVGLVALASLPGVRASRLARWGIVAATAGMALLSIMELVAMSAANEMADSSRSNLVNGLYGVPVTMVGIGLLRTPRTAWVGPAWLRVLPVMMGAYVFIPLTPAIMGPIVLGRLAIGGWMALFAVLGWGLARPETSGATPAARLADGPSVQPPPTWTGPPAV